MAITTERNDEAPGDRAKGRNAEPAARALFHHTLVDVCDGRIEEPIDLDTRVSAIARHLPRAVG